MNELPTWGGWTIDTRLKQFRKVEHGDSPSISIVEFDSDEGRDIFKEYCEDQYNYHMEEGSTYQRIIFDLEDNCFEDIDADSLADEMVNGAH